MTDSSGGLGDLLFAFCWVAGIVLAVQSASWPAAREQKISLRVLPQRVYVETCPDQIGLYDRISLHVAIVNDTSTEAELERISFSFHGADRSRYEVSLSSVVLEERLKETSGTVFVATGAGLTRRFATDLRLPVGGVAVLAGNQFTVPSKIAVRELIITARLLGAQGARSVLRQRVPIWRYQPTMPFQFPFAETWMVTNEHGPGAGHPINLFAYDFVKVRGISAHTGDGDRLEEWFGYGEPILSAASGTVVEVDQAVAARVNSPFAPLPTAEQLGLVGRVITSTLVTIGQDDIHYRPGNISWEHLSAEERGRVNGAYVIIRHSPEEFSFYAHLQPGSLLVRPGDTVDAGQPLGKCGSAGHANGPGLHFQLLYRPDPVAGLPVTFTPATEPLVHLMHLQSCFVVSN